MAERSESNIKLFNDVAHDILKIYHTYSPEVREKYYIAYCISEHLHQIDPTVTLETVKDKVYTDVSAMQRDVASLFYQEEHEDEATFTLNNLFWSIRPDRWFLVRCFAQEMYPYVTHTFNSNVTGKVAPIADDVGITGTIRSIGKGANRFIYHYILLVKPFAEAFRDSIMSDARSVVMVTRPQFGENLDLKQVGDDYEHQLSKGCAPNPLLEEIYDFTTKADITKNLITFFQPGHPWPYKLLDQRKAMIAYLLAVYFVASSPRTKRLLFQDVLEYSSLAMPQQLIYVDENHFGVTYTRSSNNSVAIAKAEFTLEGIRAIFNLFS